MLIQSLYDARETRGIPKIEIPKTEKDFLPSNNYGLTAIKKYFSTIISAHKKNAEKERFLYDYYLGKQDILNKTRLYQKDSQNNNIICENHALRQVDFKTGFCTSEPREYTAKENISNSAKAQNELTYLNRYHTSVNFFGKDKAVKEWIYATGVGATYVRPRTDIILKDSIFGYRFANKYDGFDIEYDAPFEFNFVSPIENFVVYSSGLNKEPLFSVSLVEVEVNPNDVNDTSTQIEYQVETKYAVFRINSDLGFTNPRNYILQNIKTTNNIIPIVEHWSNNSRLGIIENNKDLFDSINTLISSMEDMVVDNANMILVFKNTDIDGDTVKEMKKAGAIIIKDSSSGKQNSVADLDTIKIAIDFEGFNTFYEQRVTQAYDIAGVPLASGQVTSGGDTGQARLLGGGWSNATTISTNDTNTMKVGDYEVLKQMLEICKLYPDCPINTISASQIDIKYKLNSSDNFLVKAQGMQNLYAINMPKDMILKASGLFNDIGAGAKSWEEYDNYIKSQAKVTEQIDVTENNQDVSKTETTDNGGNNSKE